VLTWITSSGGARLRRPGEAPPWRGALLTSTGQELAPYTKRSIEFYSTNPCTYIPRPTGIRPVESVRSGRGIVSEIPQAYSVTATSRSESPPVGGR
jgi:hypothetical protein